MEMVELLVRMDSNGSERTVRKALAKIEGIDSVDVDLEQNKVTIMGYVDRKKVLKAVRKTGKRAELWNPFHQENYHLHASTSNYYSNSRAFARTYNYEKHGYNNPVEHVNGYYSSEPRDGISAMFSDDNPNACSIM